MIESVMNAVRVLLEKDAGGHDYWHTLRVYRTAMNIAEKESCDKTVVALGALLHDVDDRKLFATQDYANARRILRENGVSTALEHQVIDVISTVSFSSGAAAPDSMEGKIVQDADRLDALGAIGVARTFAYGGSSKSPMHDPDLPPRLNMTKEEYRNHRGTSVNHFYEKLFTLKDMMNTETGRAMALHRDAFLHAFLEEFFREWDGEC